MNIRICRHCAGMGTVKVHTTETEWGIQIDRFCNDCGRMYQIQSTWQDIEESEKPW